MEALAEVAQRLLGGGRGVLAVDESPTTMSGRLRAAGIEASAQLRRDYREMLVTAPGLSEHVSGVILCDETFRQDLSDGRSFPVAVRDAGLLPGVKVDTGTRPLAGAPGETITEGLDGLRERLADYHALGAVFAKWRAVLRVGPGLPTLRALRANAQALARYAALCQEAGLVPIVEPEVLTEGDHDLVRCAHVTAAALLQVCDELSLHEVRLDAAVLKPNMVTPGTGCAQRVGAPAVARETLAVLYQSVPAQVPGIAFLSGGQPAGFVTACLAAMNAAGPHPWVLTFSFGRALVDAALVTWAGRPSRRNAGQEALLARARESSRASRGSAASSLSPLQPAPVAT